MTEEHVQFRIREQDEQHEKHCMLDVLMTFCNALGSKGNEKGKLAKQVDSVFPLSSQYTTGLYTSSALWISLQLTRPTVELGSKVARKAGLKGFFKLEQPDAFSAHKQETVW